MSGSSNTIIARLEELESSYKKMKEDMVSLERDNVSLQRDIIKEQRRNDRLKKEVSALRRKVSTMEGEMEKNERRTSERISQIQNISEVLNRALVKAHENVDSRQEVMGSLQKLQLDYKTSHHHTERRLDKLETDCARNRQSVSDKIGNVETRVVKRLEEVEDIVKTQSRKVSKLVEEFETRRPEESLSAQACAPPPTQNTPTQSTPTQSTPPAPPAKNLTPQEWKRLKERSQFSVGMFHPRTIQGRTRQRVKGYDRVHRDSDCLDRKTGVFKTPVFGRYEFYVGRYAFVMDGGVRYYVCGGDGRREEVFVSCRSYGGWQDEFVYWDCPEGLEVWVEVEAGRGGDGLTYRVGFYGCLNK